MLSIDPVYARVIARELTNQGISECALFEGVGLSFNDLWLIDEISLPAFRQVLENAQQLSPGSAIGFIIGRHSNPMALGTLGVAMGSAPSLRKSLQLLESFTRLHATYMQAKLESHLGGLAIYLEFSGLGGDDLRYHVEATFCFVQTFYETISGQILDDAVYRVPFAAPSYVVEYSRYLRSAVHFSEEVVCIQLPAHQLDKPSPYYHRELWQQTQRDLGTRLRELGIQGDEVYSQHVRAQLRGHEPPLPTLKRIAETMHMSERTLNRRLQQENANFRTLRSEALNHWAAQYLLHTDATVESVAAELGYQDAANFRRAFRKLNGVTPSKFRNNGRERDLSTPLP